MAYNRKSFLIFYFIYFYFILIHSHSVHAKDIWIQNLLQQKCASLKSLQNYNRHHFFILLHLAIAQGTKVALIVHLSAVIVACIYLLRRRFRKAFKRSPSNSFQMPARLENLKACINGWERRENFSERFSLCTNYNSCSWNNVHTIASSCLLTMPLCICNINFSEMHYERRAGDGII